MPVPRLEIDTRHSGPEARVTLDAEGKKRLIAKTEETKFYPGEKGEEIQIQELVGTAARQALQTADMSVSSNLRTEPSQISQGFIADASKGILSNFRLNGRS